MKYYLYIIIVLLISSSCKKKDNQATPPPQDSFIRAVDFSTLPEIETHQIVYYDAHGTPKNALQILKDAGCNTVRIRLWHTPETVHSALVEVAAFSNRIKASGMKVWLCVHYSDTWADPAAQSKPQAWKGTDLGALKDSIYQYTAKISNLIQPDIIQIGNEVNGGFLWETGRIWNGENFYQLLNEAIRAVREVSSSKVMIHYAGSEGSEWFYQQLENQQVDYELIGLSYYPRWHGKNLDSLKTRMHRLSSNFQKEVLIAETAYPFTMEWNDMTHNIIGSDNQIIPEFPATPNGQKAFLERIKSIVSSTSGGKGFCYWGGEWVAFKGPYSQSGSPWENQALFDFNNQALPVIEVFSTD
jgi:arabinogalactan endo-1,4-beta-galactosidase